MRPASVFLPLGLAVGLCALPTLADPVPAALPPAAARIVTSQPRLPLVWPPRSGCRYKLDLWPANQPPQSFLLREPGMQVSLAAPGLYQWRVQALSAQGFSELVPARTFTWSDQLRLAYDGEDGKDGAPAELGPCGSPPRPGGAGADGGEVSLALSAVGPYVQVRQGTPLLDVFYLVSGHPPLEVSAQGGRGGRGGGGRAGLQGTWYQSTTYNGQLVMVLQPGSNGEDGASGGAGGQGGRITVTSDGTVRPSACVTAVARGGQGGPGGLGGRGGAAAYLPPDLYSLLVVGQAVPGRDGRAGNVGVSGRDGAVQLR